MNKNRFKIFAALFGLIVVLTACQPDEYTMGELMSKDQLKFSVTSDATDPNMIVLISETPGVTPMWITPMGRSTRVQDTVKIPFAGTYSFTYGVESAGGFVQADPVTIVLAQNNLNYVDHPLWTNLTGGVGHEKTWRLDYGKYGIAAGPLTYCEPQTTWIEWQSGTAKIGWAPSLSDNPWIIEEADTASRMTFSLIGGAFIRTHKITEGVDESGTFFLDAENHKISTTDATILRSNNFIANASNWNNDLVVLELTENQLMIGVRRTNSEGDYLYAWNFVSEEYAASYVPADLPDPEPPYNGEANSDLTTDVSTTKTWKVDLDYPYNWHALDGKPLNDVKTLGNDPDGFAFTTWVPPYDAAVFESISVAFTKGGDEDGTYVVKVGDTKFEGSYTVDEKNNIDFGQPISFFTGVGGWLSFGTTAENTLRVIISEKDALGNIEGIWLGQRATNKDEYLSLHFVPAATSSVVDPKDAVKKLISAKTWKIDSERTYDVTTSWGAEQGPVIFSDYATWSWNPKPGDHYASGEASIDYGTMKFETNGTIVIKQRKRIYTYVNDGGNTVTRNGAPQSGDILATDETETLNGTWDVDLDKNTISISVGMLHPWTCDYAVANWGAIKIYRIEQNALLLQALRSKELSGEDEFLMTYIFVPAE